MRVIRDPRIVAAMRLIETRSDQRLTTAELARSVGLSQFHFVRLFGEQIGETVGEYAARVRLDAAALRLRWTPEPVMSVAVGAGYGSQAAFTRAFTARTGIAPARYRVLHGPPRGLPGAADGVTVRWTEALLCLGLRTIGVRDGVTDPWAMLLDSLPRSLRSGPPPTFVDILHDNPQVTAAGQIRRDACIALPADFDPAGESFLDHGLHLIATDAAWCATTTRCGSAAAEAACDLILDRWLPAQARYRLCGARALAIYAPPTDPRAAERPDGRGAERSRCEIRIGLRVPGSALA